MPPMGPPRTLEENPRPLRAHPGPVVGNGVARSSATRRDQVTRKAELSGPCSGFNQQVQRGQPAVNRIIRQHDQLAGAGWRSVSMICETCRLAAATHGSPGPMTLHTLGTVCVPKATAAIPCAPPAL